MADAANIRTASFPQGIAFEKGDAFFVRDGRGRVVETWTCKSLTTPNFPHRRKDIPIGTFEVSGYKDAGQI